VGVPLRNALNARLVFLAAALAATIGISAVASLAGRTDEGAIPLSTPEPIAGDLAAALVQAATSDPAAGLTPGGRRAVLPPERFWETEGVCAVAREAPCAVVAVYDYTTGKGSNVVLTLEAPPRVVRVQRDVVVPLSPEEARRGYELVEATAEFQRFLEAGYDRTLSHEFAPDGPGDPCFSHRCVILDWRDLQDSAKPQLTAIFDLTAERIIRASWR
jgi:hypothetical protein